MTYRVSFRLEVRVPTNLAMIGARTYTGGSDDSAAVHALQNKYKLVSLSQWGKRLHST